MNLLALSTFLSVFHPQTRFVVLLYMMIRNNNAIRLMKSVTKKKGKSSVFG